jgi:hypothetical protein
LRTKADLAGCEARLEWINYALMALTLKVGHWINEGDPSRTVTEYYPEADVYVFRLDAELPPKRLSVETGNIVHQLRSTLDNLVWQLVLLNEEEPQGGPRGNRFPNLFSKPDIGFKEKTSNSLHGVKGTHRTAIQRLQPYERPNGIAPAENPLHLLSQLSNQDKHQELQLLAARQDLRPLDWQVRRELPKTWHPSMMHGIEIGGGEVKESMDFSGSSLRPGAVVGWAIVRREGDSPVEMKIRGDFHLLIDDLDKPLIPLLGYLARFVIQILETFRPAFQGEAVGAVDVEPFAMAAQRVTNV